MNPIICKIRITSQLKEFQLGSPNFVRASKNKTLIFLEIKLFKIT